MAAAVKKATTGLEGAVFDGLPYWHRELHCRSWRWMGGGSHHAGKPSRTDTALPIVKDYLADIKGNNVGYLFEGYINARVVLVEVMENQSWFLVSSLRASLLAALKVSNRLRRVAIQFSAKQSSRFEVCGFWDLVQDGKGCIPNQDAISVQRVALCDWTHSISPAHPNIGSAYPGGHCRSGIKLPR